MPQSLIVSELATASPAAQALVEADLELAEAARSVADFARGMLAEVAPHDPQPGALVQDALRLAAHARRVLVAAIHLERTSGTPDAVVTELRRAAEAAADDVPTPGSGALAVHPANVAVRLFDLDTWACRHAEPDDPPRQPLPVTAAVLRRLRAPH